MLFRAPTFGKPRLRCCRTSRSTSPKTFLVSPNDFSPRFLSLNVSSSKPSFLFSFADLLHAHIFAAGYTLPANSTWSTPAYPAAVPDLPAFCRFGGYIHTSNMSKVQFEVWLPDEWSGRFSMVGNGGDAGGVNFPDMWAPIKKYNMAVASTDTGRASSVRLLHAWRARVLTFSL